MQSFLMRAAAPRKRCGTGGWGRQVRNFVSLNLGSSSLSPPLSRSPIPVAGVKKKQEKKIVKVTRGVSQPETNERLRG